MENIKDLRLIVGPLNSTQCIEVSLWCDKNSTDSNKFQRPSGNVADKPYIMFSYESTSQNRLFEDDDFEDYERITYQQWYDRFIKKSKVLPKKWVVQISNYKLIEDYLINKYGKVHSWFTENTNFYLFSEEPSWTYAPKYASNSCSLDYTEISFEDFKELVLNVKQNKEEIMNKKDFTIEGSISLKKAFIEESKLPIYNEKSYDYAYLTNWDNNKGLQGDTVQSSIHFILPQDWTKALEYVKEYFKEEPKFKVGSFITTTGGNTYKITEIRDGNYYHKNGYNFPSQVRPATPGEIKSVQTKTLVLGDKQVKVTVSKGKIEAEGGEIPIKYLQHLYKIMCNVVDEPLNWRLTRTSITTNIQFPTVKLGCTTFTTDDVEKVIKTYEELND